MTQDFCIPAESVESSILLIRGKKVILDHVLARFYGVSLKVLIQVVQRNQERFPEDFMFQLTREETRQLKSRGKHSKYRPYVFTEQGIFMLTSVLRNERAVQTNIQIMRTFVHAREITKASVVKRRRIGFLG